MFFYTERKLTGVIAGPSINKNALLYLSKHQLEYLAVDFDQPEFKNL